MKCQSFAVISKEVSSMVPDYKRKCVSF